MMGDNDDAPEAEMRRRRPNQDIDDEKNAQEQVTDKAADANGSVNEYLVRVESFKNTSTFQRDWEIPEKVQEVQDYLTKELGFSKRYVTEEYCKIFMQRRWINGNNYTYQGKQVFEPGEFMAAVPDPIELIKLIHSRIFLEQEFMSLLRDTVDDLDIYRLPALNLQLGLDFSLTTMFGLTADEADQYVADVFSGMEDCKKAFDDFDTDNSGGLTEDEFMAAMYCLQDQGKKLDLNGDGDIAEEAMAIFHLINDTPDNKITYNEFQRFIQRAESGNGFVPLASRWAVWDDNTSYIFIYILYLMSMAIQYLAPIVMIISFTEGNLGESGDLCKTYPEDCGDNKTIATLVQESTLAGMCPRLNGVQVDGTFRYDQRVAMVFLFLFLVISTDVSEALAVCESYDALPDNYHTLRFSYLCEDTFFWKLSYPINLMCYIQIVVTTYLIFVTSPEMSDLIKDVVAVQFLIEVDNIAYTAVVDHSVQENLVQKMCLCYIQNGEKPESITEDSESCSMLKDVLEVTFVKALGYVGYLLYYVSYLGPIATAVCI